MTAHDPIVTTDPFAALLALPENEGRLFEFIHGELIEVMPGRTINSQIPFRIAVPVVNFCQAQNIPCQVSGADGAYRVGEHVLVPDFAYKRTPMSSDYPDPVAPLWVVEVISPTDRADLIRDKRGIYLAAGILLWELYPSARSIDVYTPGQPPRTLGSDGILDGGDVLPGFTLSVKAIFGE